MDKHSQQICYYSRNKIDKTFNFFLVIRKQTLTGEKIILSVEKLIDSTTKNNTIYTDIDKQLKNFKNDNVEYERPVTVIAMVTLEEKKQTEQNNDTITMTDESAKNQDLSQNN